MTGGSTVQSRGFRSSRRTGMHTLAGNLHLNAAVAFSPPLPGDDGGGPVAPNGWPNLWTAVEGQDRRGWGQQRVAARCCAVRRLPRAEARLPARTQGIGNGAGLPLSVVGIRPSKTVKISGPRARPAGARCALVLLSSVSGRPVEGRCVGRFSFRRISLRLKPASDAAQDVAKPFKSFRRGWVRHAKEHEATHGQEVVSGVQAHVE